MRYFFAGACVGLVAVFGRNHGVYGVVGSLGVMSWLTIKGVGQPGFPGFIRGIMLWAAGVIIGFAPVLLMVWLVPQGFCHNRLLEKHPRFLFEVKATNLPFAYSLAVEAPFDSASVQRSDSTGVLVGLFFIGTIAFGVSANVAMVTWKNPP